MKHLPLVIITLFLAACSSSSDKTTNQQDTIVPEPTYWDSIQEYNPKKMQLTIDGKSMELIYFETNEDNVFKALEIAKMDKPLKQQRLLKYDVTDDGIDDSIVFYINKHDTFAFEKGMRIFDRGRLVFKDSVIADSNYLKWLESIVWIGDSSLHHLMPYSLLASFDFADDLKHYFQDFHARKLLDEHGKKISTFIGEYCEATSEQPLEKQRDMMIYLNIYTGKSVNEIQLYEPGDEMSYIWYKADSTFVPILSFSEMKPE